MMAEGQDITHKLAKIKNFTVFLDYDQQTNGKKPLTEGIILDSKEPKQPQVFTIDYDKLYQDKSNQVFKDIINGEFEKEHGEHQYIVDRFSMEARVKLNKNILINKFPQVDLDVLFGGTFKMIDQSQNQIPIHDVVSVRLNVHQPQIIRILKLLEFIGYYNEFQKGALANYGKKPLSQETSDEYVRLYCEWRNINDDKKQAKLAEDKRKSL